MIQHLIQALGELPNKTQHTGVTVADLRETETLLNFTLPAEHQELLRWSNGLETFHGYFRLFGVSTEATVDAVRWNQVEDWKFAWKDRCLPFWFFGETALGDQYGYEISALRQGVACAVYLLDAYSMTPELIAPSFAAFLEDELLRIAISPYDELVTQAKRRFGDLEVASLLVYQPSIILGGHERVENLVPMPRNSAMICNGDVATQLDTGPSDGSVSRVEVYEDSKRRLRLRLVWA